MNKSRYTGSYTVEKSPIKTRPGYIAHLHKIDGTHETIFGRNITQLEELVRIMLDWG